MFVELVKGGWSHSRLLMSWTSRFRTPSKIVGVVIIAGSGWEIGGNNEILGGQL